MAVVKISELVVAGALTGAELMEVVQGGTNKKVTIQDIANFAGPSFYSTNGQLASDRTVDLDGKVLTFSQGGNIFLNLDPTVDAEEAALSAYNITDDGNEAKVAAQTSDTEAVFRLRSTFNGLLEASIVGSADATTSTLTYTADTHTFTGNGVGVNMTTTSVSPFGVSAIPAFANNADAVGGGLTAGMFYRISAAGTSAVAVVE